MESCGYFFYLVFIISWFLRLTVRFPVLGAFRIDLILILVIFFIFLFLVDKKNTKGLQNPCYKRLLLLIVLILFITPFAEWPGSVFQDGIQNYVKAIVFFFYTVWFIQSENRFKWLLVVFLGCQVFRILEPLYLHITQGYWGDSAFMGYNQSLNRLAGAPFDIINPNGLAFVTLTLFPFFFYLWRENVYWKIATVFIIPTSLYVLYLTGSRSGMLGFGFITVVYILKSKHKFLLFIPAILLTFWAGANMTSDFQDRYLSIFSNKSANAGTVAGRKEGVLEDFMVGMRRPIFGHGLGTSMEANAHYRGIQQRSHNLYTETFQEVGFVGLSVFLSFIYLIFKNLTKNKVVFCANSFTVKMRQPLLLFAVMNLFFSLASYGFSGYVWYLLAGMSVVVSEHA